ncbi:MAG: GNAT family N-acetyltransferase [Acidobacteria bacterium]|nr:GNAT family N-acetyltransferase [Acidobacteriota bacterium]
MASLTAPTTCAVRAAQASDGKAIAALAVQLGYQCMAPQVRKRLDDMKDSRQYRVFVAVLPDGEVVGWIGVYILRAVQLDTFAEISGLVVDETLRSRGIGKALLNAAEDWARRVGCAAISVNSNVIRDRAHRFYLSNGYELIKTQKIFRKSC